MNPKIVDINGNQKEYLRVDVDFERIDGVLHWSLRVGYVYNVVQKSPGMASRDVCDLSDMSSPIVEGSNLKTSERAIESTTPPISQIIASDILWIVKGLSEILKFMKRFLDVGASVR